MPAAVGREREQPVCLAVPRGPPAHRVEPAPAVPRGQLQDTGICIAEAEFSTRTHLDGLARPVASRYDLAHRLSPLRFGVSGAALIHAS